LTLKVYTQGERVLRLEALVPNTEELHGGRDLSRFPGIVVRLRKTLERFVEVLSWVDGCLISDETLEELPRSAWVGKSRVGGIDWNQPRMRAVAEAVTALAGLEALPPRSWPRRFSPVVKPSTGLAAPPTT
jgi:hypothetical protein